MTMPFRFDGRYFIACLALFITEILIAVYAHDDFVRPYIGDVLVVLLIYCFVRSFFATPVFTTAFCVLIFAYGIETLQYLRIVERLGLGDSKLANVVIGNYFTWVDMLSYTIGFVIILILERVFTERPQHRKA